MIEYSIQHPGFEEYNARYASKDPLFHDVTETNYAFMRKLLNLVTPRRECAVLDIGCGQGYFTSFLREHLQATRGGLAPPKVIGFDGAGVAIRQAEKRDPAVVWANDTIQHFLTVHDEHFPGQRYDVITDRCGATVVGNEGEAVELARNLRMLLKPDSFYVYLVATAWYSGGGTVKPPHLNWTRDWITLLKEQYDLVFDFSRDGFHQLAFLK